MVLARPVRALAGVSFLLLLFLLFQILRSPSPLDEPEERSYVDGKDPMSERTSLLP